MKPLIESNPFAQNLHYTIFREITPHKSKLILNQSQKRDLVSASKQTWTDMDTIELVSMSEANSTRDCLGVRAWAQV